MKMHREIILRQIQKVTRTYVHDNYRTDLDVDSSKEVTAPIIGVGDT